MTRTAWLTLAALAAVLSCRRPVDKSSTVTFLLDDDEGVLGMPYDEPPKFLVFLPLVTRNAQGELEGRLARSWEHSPDYRNWTIHLRSDVRWQDGTPVTAHDIKFTLELMTRPELLSLAPGSVSVTVLDDTTYTLVLHHGTTGSPLDDYTTYYPKHLLERLDPKQIMTWDFWVHPVGDGPYRYIRHVPKTMTELEANPDYYRGKARIAHVVLCFGSKTSLVTELLSGNVDAVEYVNQMDLPKLLGDRRFQAYHRFEPGVVGAVIWNLNHPAFRDPKVRRALTLAIDRRELYQALNFPTTTPIFDVIFTGRQLRRGELPPPLPHDTAEARRLLVEAGWAEVGPDGIRRRGGEPFRFVAVVIRMDREAIMLQAQLRAVGIQMDIQPGSNRAKSGTLVRPMPMDGRFPWGEFFGANSPSGYHNARVVTLFERARAAVNPDEIDAVYQELAPLFQADLPVTFLAPAVGTAVADRRLRGLSSPYRADPFYHMDDLWLEPEP